MFYLEVYIEIKHSLLLRKEHTAAVKSDTAKADRLRLVS